MSASKSIDWVYRNFHYEEETDVESKIYHASYGGNLETINIAKSKITKVISDGTKFLVYTGKSSVPFKIHTATEKHRKFLLKEWKDFFKE